ncbi:MAG: metal ABC transporter permease [Epsilonproteobacteria bacterium]|nr:metal ABC transporter permease [Campylobacterota bacterium]
MIEALELFSNSLIASLLLSFAVALIGPLMLINRYNYLAASIAHGSYGGVGLAIYFGISILLGATLFALFLAFLLALITFKEKYPEILISLVWAVGMSIGIIFIDLAPGYKSDLLAYLFGDILLVPNLDLWFMVGVDLLLLAFVALYKNHLLALAYDREFATLRGLDVKFLHTLTLIMIALTVVMSIRSIGLILVIALFSIPPYIAEKFSRSYVGSMVLSGIITLIVMIAGLFISYTFNISASASIILFTAVLFLGVFKR